MSDSRRRVVIYGLILITMVLVQSQPAWAAGLSSEVTPSQATYGMDHQAPLGPGQAHVAELQARSASWQQVAEVIFVPAGRQGTGNKHGVRTGTLSWLITAAGTVVQDNRTGAVAHIPELTSTVVRPREVLYDRRAGVIWFYGAGLYRYRLGGHQLERLQPEGASWPAIRKMVRSAAGLWLVTSSNIFLLGGADGTLKALQDTALANRQFSNLAAAGEVAWVATAERRLIRMTVQSPHQVALEISRRRLPGIPAELTAVGRSLWLLLADRHGEHYRLAVVEQGSPSIGLMDGRYDTLQARGGQLFARVAEREYRIDTTSKTATAVRAAASGLLMRAQRRGAILFTGSSYGKRGGSETVQSGRADISRGWTDTLNAPRLR